jgi:hypothetical protein
MLYGAAISQDLRRAVKSLEEFASLDDGQAGQPEILKREA